MSAIIIPRRHLVQPHGRVAVDWRHAATQGLSWASVDGVSDAVGVAQIVSNTALTQGVSNGAAANFASSAGMRGTLKRATTFTIRFGLQIRSYGGGSQGRVFERSGDTGYGEMLISSHNTGGAVESLRLQWGSVIAYSNMSLPVGEYAIWHCVFKPESQLRIYKNGVELIGWFEGTSNSGVISDRIIWGNRHNGERALDGLINAAAIWDGRELSQNEIAEDAANPWQLFRADPIRIYSFPTGPISLTINNILASNITSSGARITLGLTR